MSTNISNISVRTIQQKDITLDQYKGKVLLIVNTASECGLTPQYEGLEKLYDKYKAQGFEVLGFPANEFGAQEPGTDAQIKDFCEMKFNIKFPMFSKIVVKGPGQHPLYQALVKAIPYAVENIEGTLRATLKQHNLMGDDPTQITWNFEKFLIDREGNVVGRFDPDLEPQNAVVVAAIEAQLK